jgi:hypothetical protein
MTWYRLFVFADAEVGDHDALESVSRLECSNDLTAIDTADREREGRVAELWHDRRFVKAFGPAKA